MDPKSGDKKAPADPLFSRIKETDLHSPEVPRDAGAAPAPSATEDALWLTPRERPVLGDVERRYGRIVEQLVQLSTRLLAGALPLLQRWEEGPSAFRLQVLEGLLPSAAISNDLRKDLQRALRRLRELEARRPQASAEEFAALDAEGLELAEGAVQLVREESVELELLLAAEQVLGQRGKEGSVWNLLAEYAKQLGFFYGLHLKVKKDATAELKRLDAEQRAAAASVPGAPGEARPRLLAELLSRAKRQQPMAPGTF